MSDGVADLDADAEVMARLRAGEDLALNELMTRWQEPVVRFLYRYTGSEADAVDLAQETFVRVYSHRSSYDGRGRFSTWLFTIAGNLARNHARWKSRHPAISMDAITSPESDRTLGDELSAEGGDPAQEAAQAELSAAVREAVQALPDEQRSATILYEYEGLSYAEIAPILGCTIKAVEKKLYHARQTLREKLAKWW